MADVQEKIQEQPLEGSETSENNNLSESENQEMDLSSDVPQEDDARKFQSMYDKSQAELERLKPVAQLFQDNPELVDVVRTHLTGGKGQDEEQIKLTQEEFNPWEAYTNPGSDSYRMRQKEIDDAVSDKMKSYTNRLDQQRQVDNLTYQVQSDYKLSNDEAKQFVNFVTQPKENLPLDTLFKVWKGDTPGARKAQDNVNAAKKAQSNPRSAGLMQGGQPPQANAKDDVWNKIMSVGNPTSIKSGIKK